MATSKKFYLAQAIYFWCLDNNFTPYIVVFVDNNVKVPIHVVDEDNSVMFDISVDFVQNFEFNKDYISFITIFDQVEHEVFIPIGNILEIYSAENEEGLSFEFEKMPTPIRKNKLKLIK